MVSNLAKKRTSFGVASLVALNKTTGLPYGILKIIQSAEPSLDRDKVDLFGGSNPSPFESEDGNLTGSLTVTLSEFKPFLYELAGYTVSSTEGTAESTGSVTSMSNLVGISTSTGLVAALSTGTGQPANLRRGRFVFKAVTASTVDVYVTNDNDFSAGTALDYVNDNLKITTGAISVSGTVAEVPRSGITIKTAGTLTSGDVGYCDVVTTNNGKMTYTYGENPVPVEFELFVTSQKKANGEYFIDHYPRVKFSSVPASMNAKEWSYLSLNMKLLFDSTYGYFCKRFDKVAP